MSQATFPKCFLSIVIYTFAFSLMAQSSDTQESSTDVTTISGNLPKHSVSSTDPENDIVGEWSIIGLLGPRRLPNGTPLDDICGYERDVLVKPIASQNTTAESNIQESIAILEVPCQQTETGMIAGKAIITLKKKIDSPNKNPTTTAIKKAEQPTIPLTVTQSSTPKSLTKPTSPDTHTSPVNPVPSPSVNTTNENRKNDSQAQKPLPAITNTKDKEAMLQKSEEPKPSVGTQSIQEDKKNLSPQNIELKKAPTVDAGFLKGELTQAGNIGIVNIRKSFGVGVGLSFIDGVYYLQLRPDFNWHWDKWKLGLGFPIRLELADTRNLNAIDPTTYASIQQNMWRFRTQDWDQIEDFVRPLRYLTYGRKEDNLYFDINRVKALTLGHGQLVRRYMPNVDIDEDNSFATLDAYGDKGGVELFIGPLPLPRMLGALGFLKPFGFSSTDNVTAKSISLGLNYVVDLNTPTIIQRIYNPADQRPMLMINDKQQLVGDNEGKFVSTPVQGLGVDGEIKVLKNETTDIKLYADYTRLFLPGAFDKSFAAFSSGGGTIGSILRANVGKKFVRELKDETEDVQAGKQPREEKAAHAFRVRLEGRLFEPRYLPSYFNASYEIDRLQMGATTVEDRIHRASLPTKIGALAAMASQPNRLGIYIEATYLWVDRFGVTASFEDAAQLGSAAAAPLKNLMLHAETSGFEWFQAFVTYHYRNAQTWSQVLSFKTDHELLFFGARLQFLPFLFVNAGAQRAFRMGFSEDDTPGYVDPNGYRYTSTGLLNAWVFNLDLEAGWQF
jgi:hypothetical protein